MAILLCDESIGSYFSGPLVGSQEILNSIEVNNDSVQGELPPFRLALVVSF